MYKELDWSEREPYQEASPSWYLISIGNGHRFYYDMVRKLFIWQFVNLKYQYTAPLPHAINK